jgi:hypothetical protein
MVPKKRYFLCVVMIWSAQLGAQSTDSAPQTNGTTWEYGIQASAGYFNFRDSLFVNIEPDPPGNLSDDWLEFVICLSALMYLAFSY